MLGETGNLKLARLATVSPSIAGLTDAKSKGLEGEAEPSRPPATALRTAHRDGSPYPLRT
jgi:hypothetical protein